MDLRGKFQKEVIKKICPASQRVLLNYIKRYGTIKFFSYGSNMNEKQFKEEMQEAAGKLKISLNRAELGLLNPIKCTLLGFKRVLSNKSKRHGIAFSICPAQNSIVEGICHEVHERAIMPFFKKEGLFQRSPNYVIIQVKVLGDYQPVFTLFGIKPMSLEELTSKEKRKALNYLDICIEGAIKFHVDYSDMIDIRNRLMLLNRNGNNSSK